MLILGKFHGKVGKFLRSRVIGILLSKKLKLMLGFWIVTLRYLAKFLSCQASGRVPGKPVGRWDRWWIWWILISLSHLGLSLSNSFEDIDLKQIICPISGTARKQWTLRRSVYFCRTSIYNAIMLRFKLSKIQRIQNFAGKTTFKRKRSMNCVSCWRRSGLLISLVS